jgi:hypothetical protein
MTILIGLAILSGGCVFGFIVEALHKRGSVAVQIDEKVSKLREEYGVAKTATRLATISSAVKALRELRDQI